MNIAYIHSSRDRQALCNAPSLPAFDAEQIDDHDADAHLCAVDGACEVYAHCSLWWREAPPFGAHRVGAIGHYASVDDPSASALIESAIEHLRQHGCTIAIGPMDGNTWRRYRFITGSGSEPAFFMEPTNPPEWPQQFERAGFTPLAEYYSALNSNLAAQDDRMPRIEARLADRGVKIRTATGVDLDDLLGRIYQVSRVAFTHNFLYTELSLQAFRAQYAKILHKIRPELVLLAERGDELVGYLFAIPDLAQAARGAIVDTFLIKTVAILPDADLGGLGGLLVARAHEQGLRAGFRRCIHALMHESNVSRNISGHYATTMRRYTLFGREIAP